MNNKTEKEVIPSAKDSSVNLGKTLFVFTCFDLARFFCWNKCNQERRKRS